MTAIGHRYTKWRGRALCAYPHPMAGTFTEPCLSSWRAGVGHLQEPTSEVWSLSVSWKECHSRGWVLCDWFWAKAPGTSEQFVWATLTPSTLNTITTHPSWYPRLLYQDSRVFVTPRPQVLHQEPGLSSFCGCLTHIPALVTRAQVLQWPQMMWRCVQQNLPL